VQKERYTKNGYSSENFYELMIVKVN